MVEDIRWLFGRRLRLLRLVRGWSQEVLGEVAGLHRTHISTIERGACNVSLSNLDRLARALEIPVGDLLSGHSIDVLPFVRYDERIASNRKRR